MHSTLEALLRIGAPLFAAATSSKRKPAKKASKKKIEKKPARTRAKPAKKAQAKSPKPTAQKGVKAKPANTRTQATTTNKPAAASPKIERIEVLPKPPAPIGRAIPLLPENEKYVDTVHPTFRWLSVGGATRYEVQWSEDNNLAASYSVMSIATEVTIPVEKPLRVGPLYYWRVRGGNEGGWGPWSSTNSFHVLEQTE